MPFRVKRGARFWCCQATPTAPPPDSRRLVPDPARGDEGGAFPSLIIVRRASTRSTSFVLAALRALHVDRAFTAGALLRYRGNAEMCWDAWVVMATPEGWGVVGHAPAIPATVGWETPAAPGARRTG